MIKLFPQPRSCIFAIPKNARFSVSGGLVGGTKISTAEELSKALTKEPLAAELAKLQSAIVRPIVAGKDAAEIAKQVDFAKEYLVLFRWKGFGQDGVSFTVKEEKDGPVVVFIHIEDPRLDSGAEIKLTLGPRSNIFAIAKNARFTGGPSEGTKITSAEELAKALAEPHPGRGDGKAEKTKTP